LKLGNYSSNSIDVTLSILLKLEVEVLVLAKRVAKMTVERTPVILYSYSHTSLTPGQITLYVNTQIIIYVLLKSYLVLIALDVIIRLTRFY